MTEQTIHEIADAAIEFIEARLKAAELREKRADALRDSECAAGDIAPPCYLTATPLSVWCERCRRSQPFHEAYRAAAAHRTAALVKLKRLVRQRHVSKAAKVLMSASASRAL